jgi:hypothetical protein
MSERHGYQVIAVTGVYSPPANETNGTRGTCGLIPHCSKGADRASGELC